MNSRIILASSSPRRIEMLKKIGIEPVVMVPEAEETLPFTLSMEQSVMFLALKKALYVEGLWLKERSEGPGAPSGSQVPADSQVPTDSGAPSDSQTPAVIIAADTVVYKEAMIGKPESEADLVNTLRALRNTSHIVSTGVALVRPGAPKRTLFYDLTRVFFTDYSDEEILRYAATEEPWDKAGGYAIQGTWGKYVSHIVGNQDNVIGFPWERIKAELERNWPEIEI